MIKDFSLCRVLQLHQHTHEGRFAAPTLSDDTKRLSFIDIQADIIAGRQAAFPGSRIHLCDMFRLQYNIGITKQNAHLPSPEQLSADPSCTHWKDGS